MENDANVNGLSVLKLFQLSNDDFFFRSMPIASTILQSTHCMNIVRAVCSKLGYTFVYPGYRVVNNDRVTKLMVFS